MLNTSKIHALWAGVSAFVLEMVSYIVAIPPADQDEIAGLFVSLFPEHYRGTIGTATKLGARLFALYAVISAARSGPQTAPKNSPTS